MFVATTCSIIFGAGMPGFSFFFGDMINGIGEATTGDTSAFKDSAVLFILIGGIVAIVSWL